MVWAPEARDVDLILESEGAQCPMTAGEDGCFDVLVGGLKSGARYRYRLDGAAVYPDPASRCQPHGVHGSSAVVDPRAYRWHDDGWKPPPQRDLVFYELHVGTFTREGTFGAAQERLGYLRDLGITAVELMPVGDFPGRWNWGYDTAACFAPAGAYGAPDDLRAFVDHAHGKGIAVVLDVVYNHFGPDGAYAAALSPRFFSQRHTTPWGPALNFDGEDARMVRAFFIENALHWLLEYHMDGLRLDATHAIVDESPLPFLRELGAAVRMYAGRTRYLIAEDHRNLNRLVLPTGLEGYGLDGVWSDDYHHQMRRILTGEHDGYFADFRGSTQDLATTIRRGWLFTGQYSEYFGGPRGTDPRGIPLEHFVHFLQNHDQIGNRPHGDRLSERVDWPVYRAASALLLLAPELPLVFMGQEWGARTRFHFFTDHEPVLGELVRAGRRKEFARFVGFGGDVPDPQASATFEQSRLDWAEAVQEPHARILRLYRDLLALRGEFVGPPIVESPVEGGLVLSRGRHALLVAFTAGVSLSLPPGARILWTTEDARYADPADPPRATSGVLTFRQPAAVVAGVGGP
jgi:maltooligosyltrehalose trehalohydrolase